MSTTVLTGHCLDVLPTLVANSVQACVTSPPYYQLRSYKTEPQVWGGEAGCEHVFTGGKRRPPAQGYSDKSTLAGFTNPDTKGRRMAKASALPGKVGASVPVDGGGERSAGRDVEQDAERPLLGVQAGVQSEPRKQRHEPIGERTTAGGERRTAGRVNGAVPVKESADVIPHDLFGNIAPGNGETLARRDAESPEDIHQSAAVDGPAIGAVSGLGPLDPNRCLGRDEVADEAGAAFVQADETDRARLDHIAVSDHQAQEVSQVRRPFGQTVETDSVGTLTGANAPGITASEGTERPLDHLAVPLGTAQRLAAAGALDSDAGVLAGDGAAPADTDTGRLDGEGTAARLARHSDWHPNSICEKCGAFYGELGQEPDPSLYVAHLVDVFRAVRRVLRPDGVLMVNIADSMVGSGKGGNGQFDERGKEYGHGGGVKERFRDYPRGSTGGGQLAAKNLYGIPWRLAFALQADGWILRQDIIWSKPAPMPESVRDRCTRSHEYVFHFSKQARYFWDADAIREPSVTTPEQAATKWAARRSGTGKGQADSIYHPGGKPFVNDPNPLGANKRSVWTINTAGYSSGDQDTDHFAVMPDELAETCIRATTSEKGCCAACGAPWQRAIERERGKLRGPGLSHLVTQYGGVESRGLGYEAGTGTTTGWQPTCGCDAGKPVPCTVLDCFSGAGTTVLAADRLGRHGIGIELNPAYADLATRRVYDDAPLLAAIEGAA